MRGAAAWGRRPPTCGRTAGRERARSRYDLAGATTSLTVYGNVHVGVEECDDFNLSIAHSIGSTLSVVHMWALRFSKLFIRSSEPGILHRLRECRCLARQHDGGRGDLV